MHRPAAGRVFDEFEGRVHAETERNVVGERAVGSEPTVTVNLSGVKFLPTPDHPPANEVSNLGVNASAPDPEALPDRVHVLMPTSIRP